MNMQSLLVGSALGALLPTPAFADGLAGKLRGQAQLEVLPSGSVSVSNDSTSTSTGTDTAFGLTAMLDYEVTPYFALGVAPRLVLNVKLGDPALHDSAGEELDLRAHLLGHVPVAPKVELYASLSPGYADLLDDAHSNLSGFALAGALGATYTVSPRAFLSFELGYQRAFSSRTFNVPFPGGPTVAIKADTDLSYLHLGFGAGTHF